MSPAVPAFLYAALCETCGLLGVARVGETIQEQARRHRTSKAALGRKRGEGNIGHLHFSTFVRYHKDEVLPWR